MLLRPVLSLIGRIAKAFQPLGVNQGNLFKFKFMIITVFPSKKVLVDLEMV